MKINRHLLILVLSCLSLEDAKQCTSDSEFAYYAVRTQRVCSDDPSLIRSEMRCTSLFVKIVRKHLTIPKSVTCLEYGASLSHWFPSVCNEANNTRIRRALKYANPKLEKLAISCDSELVVDQLRNFAYLRHLVCQCKITIPLEKLETLHCQYITQEALDRSNIKSLNVLCLTQPLHVRNVDFFQVRCMFHCSLKLENVRHAVVCLTTNVDFVNVEKVEITCSIYPFQSITTFDECSYSAKMHISSGRSYFYERTLLPCKILVLNGIFDARCWRLPHIEQVICEQCVCNDRQCIRVGEDRFFSPVPVITNRI